MKESEKIEAMIKETEAKITANTSEIERIKQANKYNTRQLNTLKKLHVNALENEKKS